MVVEAVDAVTVRILPVLSAAAVHGTVVVMRSFLLVHTIQSVPTQPVPG